MSECMVIIDKNKTICGQDSIVTYTCVIDVDGEEQIHNVNVCQKHRRYFDEGVI